MIQSTAPFLTDSIQEGYSDKVLVSIHSYTVDVIEAIDAVEYAYKKGATGLYVSLTGHRGDGVQLRDIHGKEWIQDTTLVTNIAQGFGNKVILAGFSLGGILSIEQAKRYPKHVAGYLAMSPSFHGGPRLPHSESSCLARFGLIRGIAEKLSGQSLNNDFILGGCAIFRVSKSITSNAQSHLFATYDRNNAKFFEAKLHAKRQMKNLTMPGVILYSGQDQVVSKEVIKSLSEVLKDIAGKNFTARYFEDGPSHIGDSAYFQSYYNLDFDAYDAIDLLFKKVN